MRYTVRKSIVNILGRIWLPPTVCAQTIKLSDYDIGNCKDESGFITRESVEQWLARHSGDFQHVLDFSASIEHGRETIEIPWESEDNECVFADCTYPED